MSGLKNRIFLIDDSQAEPLLLQQAVNDSGKGIILECFDDSKKAVEEIFDRQRDVTRTPNLILLDLNMPGYSGLDVLKILRADEQTRYLPVVILTSSSLNSDLRDCMDAGANGVIMKPSGTERYAEIVANLYEYWFNTVNRLDRAYGIE